jgi:hypothetical protein
VTESERAAVTLQVSLTPTDLPHARILLPHQLRTWAAQVEEVLLVVDGLRHARGGRFAEGWDERRPGLHALLEECAGLFSGVRVEGVDDAPQVRAEVGERFFGGREPPLKDGRGGPFYAYFFALHAARHELVLHIDSDMLFGGGSQTWATEAAALLSAREDVLACNPLGGPPTRDRSRWRDPPEPHDSPAFRCSSISTRVFLVDRRRLGPLPLRPPSRLRSRVNAKLRANPAVAFPEDLMTEAMHERGMVRIDLLGRDPGMWTLHPPYRSEKFYEALPELLRRVETGDVPERQRGDYDLNDSMFDWTEARAAFRRARWRV